VPTAYSILIKFGNNFNFQINDIQEVDTGIYRCQIVIGLHDIISAEVELKVRGPPMIHDNSTSSMVVMEGQQVTLECYTRGYPIPKIYWKREVNGISLASRSIFKYYTFIHLLSLELKYNIKAYFFLNYIRGKNEVNNNSFG